MFQDKLLYDEVCDLEKVSQTGFVDIVKANQTSSVPAALEVDESRFNGIEDPASIGLRPRDEFERQQANVATVNYKAPKKDESSSSE